MINAAIADGDIVVVRQQPIPCDDTTVEDATILGKVVAVLRRV